MKFLRNNYTISSNLIFGTFIIGIANLFVYDPESTTDFIMIGVVLVLRYVLAVMIKRRFAWSLYLMIILLIRSVYRSVYIIDNINVNPIAKVNVVMQLVMSVLAFGILFIMPKLKKLKTARKNKPEVYSDSEMPLNLQ
ncbi:hypothetical protein DHW03_16485 [Pedobacter yonginense]|uniref:Uncharacterized protein n=1 Tax=Pedobacter yonginense TaxID=651869 RepID=A0A317EMV8_9SPHI|nr:hypothetical protein [Pedobacter yonginense]PWS26378.1 hypothetical protein DHW03_16485 [Pedobacter yonginense]